MIVKFWIKNQNPFLSLFTLFDGDTSRLDSVEQKVCRFRFSVDVVSVVYYLESASHLFIGDALSIGKELQYFLLYHCVVWIMVLWIGRSGVSHDKAKSCVFMSASVTLSVWIFVSAETSNFFL